jgi:hypothetical protein
MKDIKKEKHVMRMNKDQVHLFNIINILGWTRFSWIIKRFRIKKRKRVKGSYWKRRNSKKFKSTN